MFAKDGAETNNPVELEQQIESVEKELLEVGSDTESLQRSLDELAEVLGQPAHWLSRRERSMRLNYMGIRVEESSGEASNPLDLVELYSASGEHRIILPGYIPRMDLPERPISSRRRSVTCVDVPHARRISAADLACEWLATARCWRRSREIRTERSSGHASS